MLWFGALGVVLMATTVVAQPTLFVVMPNLMRFDSLEKVILEYSGGGNPVDVKITLQNYPDRVKTFSIRNTRVQPDSQEIVRVEAKLTDMPRGSLARRNYIYVKVECAALRFNKEAVVLLTGNKGYLFLQTDKPLYAPKQEVSIRAVSLNPEMLPANTEFALDILNPNGTIFEHFEGRAQKGFFSKKVKLPDVTILGMWTVKAVYKNRFQSSALTSSVQFEVKEYVLPTFKVSVKTPDYILRSNQAIAVTVKAQFVYKEPVKGRMSIVFTLKKKDGSTPTVAMRTYSNFDGEMVVDLRRADFGNKWFPDVGTRFVVDATVTEEASGSQEMATDESAMFVDSPYIVSFERTTKYFKPSLSYNLKLDIKYANGQVAANIPMEVTAFARLTGRADRVEVFRDDAEDAGFRSDNEGRKLLTLDLPANAEDLKITVKTTNPEVTDAEQASKDIVLIPQTTTRRNFLSIQLTGNPARIPVGRKIGVRVDFTEDVNKMVTFMVLARGKVVSLTSVAVNGLSKHENIDITAQMSPQARLVVYYISKGNPNEVIVDSLVLDVSKTCEEELVLSHGQPDQSYRPGENVRFKIETAEGSMVSLLAVDRAVYLRGGERDLLTRDKMFRKIMDLDLGCGPGSGKNTGEVFRDAGLNILSNQVNIPGPHRLSAECPGQKSRKRRSASQGVRRSTLSNRMINALMKYNDQNKVCCQDGFSEQVQQQVVSGSTCDAVAQSKRLTHASCKNAFIYCCQLERNASFPTGRSAGDDSDEFNEDDLADVPVREDFPETWFSELFEMQDDETEEVRPLPDSITTWVVSGVSVSEDAGMCVAKPIDVTAKLKFFIHVELPYAAVRGEQLEVKATVYNFGTRQIRAQVWMTGDRSKLCFTGDSQDRTQKLFLNLPAKSGKKVTFPVVPLVVGEQEVTVKALTAFSAGDIIIKKLLVRAEGVRRVATVSTRLDPEGIMGDAGTGGGSIKINIDPPNKRQTIEIPLSFPADAIPGTKICRAAISGSLLGQFVPTDVDLNLASRIRLPTGCGEQTMMSMGPLVYSTRFMLDTNALTGALEQTAYRHILAGFRKELTYKHPDGSYAAWQRTPSSAWLTAFVAKVFCQASRFPNVGTAVAPHAAAAINWLITRAQKRDGRFWEPRSVYHRDMFGQNLKNDVTFTAFVVEAISGCGAVNGIDITSGNIANKLRLAVNYLNRQRNSQNKPYEQAILTYALALQNSPHKSAANQKLRRMSSIDPATGMRYWTPDGTVVPENTTPVWYKTKPSAYAVETASYALLAQLAIGGDTESYFQYAGPIASWLIRQRTVTGVFVSTTDTVIALEALTAYAGRAHARSQLNMNVRVFSGGDALDRNIRLNPANAYAPQKIDEDLPIDGTLNIEATGSGLGEVQVECQYHSPEKAGEVCTFNLKVTSREGEVPVEELNNEIEEVEAAQGNGGGHGNVETYVTEIKAEFSYIGAGNQVGMSILDVTLFTGFRAVDRDLINLKRQGIIDRYEVTSSSVLMYLGEVKKNKKTTVTFRAKQVEIVKDVQPAAVTIYDYYEPERHYCTKYYHPKQGSPLLATICDKDDEGRQVCQCAASACVDFWGFKQGQRPHLKTKQQMSADVCSIYEYAVKIRTGPVQVNGALSKMEGTVELNIKSGSQVYSTGDKIHFVWNSKCENPEMKPATSYLVMGKDGVNYVDANGRGAMRYVLDSSSYVVEWYGPRDKPRYHRALETFAREMIEAGCGL